MDPSRLQTHTSLPVAAMRDKVEIEVSPPVTMAEADARVAGSRISPKAATIQNNVEARIVLHLERRPPAADRMMGG